MGNPCAKHAPLTDPEYVRNSIKRVCHEIEYMLLNKNTAYGNSIFDPVRVFSKAPIAEQIAVRMDDKLSRIARGEAQGEDSLLDLLGYGVLHCVLRQLEEAFAHDCCTCES